MVENETVASKTREDIKTYVKSLDTPGNTMYHNNEVLILSCFARAQEILETNEKQFAKFPQQFKEMRIFELRDNLNFPLKSDHNDTASINIGDKLFCENGVDVYARHWEDGHNTRYVLLLNDLTFILANPTFFHEL